MIPIKFCKFFITVDLLHLLLHIKTIHTMGSGWSKEKTTEVKSEVRSEPSLETVERPAHLEKSGSKRTLHDEEVVSSPSKKKRQQFKKKESWAKKEGKEGKASKAGGLQARPEHLGPREPRVPKKKVALLVGFNGTGYQGMQLLV